MKRIISFNEGLNAKYDENVLPIKYASMAYGFDYSSGALKLNKVLKDSSILSSSVIEEIAEIDEIKRVYYFKKYDFDNDVSADKLIIIDGENSVHYINIYDNPQTLVSLGISFNEVPVGTSYRLNSEDVFIFASSQDDMTVWDGVNSPEVIVDAPKITSMAVHYERLFVTTAGDKSELWFSDDLDPTNWNISLADAGLIQMVDERGALRKVLSFNGYLYIFRDYGISRLSASGGQESFYLSHLFTSSGRIYPETIALCGDRVIFVASDGIYSFDGLNTTKILQGVYPILFGFDNSVACFYDGKYYLTCKASYNDNSSDEYGDRALLIYSVKDKTEMIIRGENILGLIAINSDNLSNLMILEMKNTPKLVEIADFDESDNASYTSFSGLFKHGLTDFNEPERYKTIRKVHLSSNKSASLKLFSEEDEITVNILSGTGTYPCILSGRKIGFAISCDSVGAIISDLAIEY